MPEFAMRDFRDFVEGTTIIRVEVKTGRRRVYTGVYDGPDEKIGIGEVLEAFKLAVGSKRKITFRFDQVKSVATMSVLQLIERLQKLEGLESGGD